MYIIRPRNFRIRSRIYPTNGYYPRFWGVIGSNVSDIDQNITNFGTQTNVKQEANVNQKIDVETKYWLFEREGV